MQQRELKKHLGVIEALSEIDNKSHVAQVLPQLNDDTFNFICTCVKHLLNKSSPYFSLTNSDTDLVRRLLAPEKKRFLYLANPRVTVRNKKKLLFKNQTVGAFGIATLLGSLLPVIVEGIIKLVTKKKKK